MPTIILYRILFGPLLYGAIEWACILAKYNFHNYLARFYTQAFKESYSKNPFLHSLMINPVKLYNGFLS